MDLPCPWCGHDNVHDCEPTPQPDYPDWQFCTECYTHYEDEFGIQYCESKLDLIEHTKYNLGFIDLQSLEDMLKFTCEFCADHLFVPFPAQFKDYELLNEFLEEHNECVS